MDTTDPGPDIFILRSVKVNQRKIDSIRPLHVSNSGCASKNIQRRLLENPNFQRNSNMLESCKQFSLTRLAPANDLLAEFRRDMT